MRENPDISPERPRKRFLRRFLQFRLRTLLFLLTLVTLALASYYTYVRPYEEQYEAGWALSDKRVKFEWRTARPEWLARFLSRFRDDDVFRDCITIEAESSRLTDEDLVRLEKMPRLERLYLARNPIADKGLQHLVGLEHLERLSLWGTNVTDEGMRSVAKLPALKVLDIHQVNPKLTGVRRTFGSDKADDCNVRDLHRHVFSGNLASDCLQHLKGARNLRALHFTFAVDDDGLTHLAEFENLRIRTLYLGGVTDRGLSTLPHFRELETLVISRATLDSGGLQHVARLPKLQSLELRFVQGSAPGWQELGDAEQLETLSIVSSSIDGAGLRRLRGLKQLKSLWLESNGLSDDDVAELAGLSNLRELDLLKESLTADALAGLQDMDQLEALRIDTALDDEALRSLARMPRLRQLRMSPPRYQEHPWKLYVTDAGLADLAKLRCIYQAILYDAKDGLGLEGIDAPSETAAMTKEGFARFWAARKLSRLSIHAGAITTDDVHWGPDMKGRWVRLLSQRPLSELIPGEIGIGEGSATFSADRLLLHPPADRGPDVVTIALTGRDPLLEVLRHMPELKQLRLGSKRYFGCPPRKWENLRFVANLEEFWMPVSSDAHDCIDAVGIRHLGEMEGLRRLICRLPDEFAAEDLTPLADLKNLESLDIYCAAMMAEHTRVLSQLKSLKKLRILGPPESSPRSIGAQHLVDLRELEELELYGVTDEEMPALAKIENLAKLSLRRLNISDEAFECFDGMTMLEELDVDSKSITLERRKRIAESLPHLTIRWN